jgi:hypothetical protein
MFLGAHRWFVVVIAELMLALLVGAAAFGDDGPTPSAAARARTERYAKREQVRGGGTSYRVTSCGLLHKRPWVAYGCRYVIVNSSDGSDPNHRCELILAIKRLPSGRFDAKAVSVRHLNNEDC